ncbi:MAG: FG-GAP-like repeat-containing protein [Candidatus Methanofastidiosia archaeon]
MSLVIIGILLIFGSTSSSKTIAPLWNYKIENMTNFAISTNGEYIIVTCETGPLCEKGQFYVFDRYGNTVTHGCIDNEITVVDIADNGAFFIGTRSGYYFSSSSGRVLEDMKMGGIFESVSISKNGETVIAGTNKEILVFDGNGIRDRKETDRPAEFTDISDSGDMAVAGTKNMIFLYKKLDNIWEENPAHGNVRDLTISGNGSTIACNMTSSRFIYILNSQLNEQETYLLEGAVTSIAMTERGCLLCGTQKGRIYYLDSSGNEIWNYSVDKIVKDVVISSDGSLSAVLSGNIVLFNSSGKKIKELGTSETIQNMNLSKFGEILSYNTNEELFFYSLYQHDRLACEYMIPSRKSIPLEDQLVEVWSTTETKYGAMITDINGDGQNEIICSLEKGITALNSRGEVLWKRSFPFKPGFGIMDLTGDLIPEIVVKSDDNRMEIQVLDNKGQYLTSHEFYSEWYSAIPSESDPIRITVYWSGNIDNDEFIEVVCVVSAGYRLVPRGLFVFEYPSFNKEWFFPAAPYISPPSFVDINGDGRVEIITGSFAPCNGKKVGNTDDFHAYVYAVTLDGKELWTRQIGTSGYKRVHIAVADLNGDGTQEIVGGGWSFKDNWGALFVLDSNGNFVSGEENEFNHSVYIEGVTDLDDDGNLEIITSVSPSTITIYDYRLRELNRRDVPLTIGQHTQVKINDIDADGEKEIILTSEDPKLLILSTNLEEEWSKTFPGYNNFLRAQIANLNKCKNHLFVIADKLYVYTYSNNLDWPCIPWVITGQQKIVEAEGHIEKGDEYLEEKNCDNARAEFTQAKEIYNEIKENKGINQADNKIQISENCSSVKKSLGDAEKLFEEADKFLSGVYLSDPEEYLSEAEDYLSNIKNKLIEAEEAYKKVWEGESEEVKDYHIKVEEIQNAVNYFGTGRKQLKEGKIEKAEKNLRKAMEIFNRYGWSNHVERIERLINVLPPSPTPDNGWGTIAKIGPISSVIGIIITILIFIYQERIKKYLSREKIDSSFKQSEQVFEKETDKSSEQDKQLLKREISEDRKEIKENKNPTKELRIRKNDIQNESYERKNSKKIEEFEENNDDIKKIGKNQEKFRKEKIDILKFRNKRTLEIKSEISTPFPLKDTAKVVLHIVPTKAFSYPVKLDLSSLTIEDVPLLCGPQGNLNRQYNPTNFLLYWGNPQKFVRSYVQVFDNGIIEAVDTYLLNISNKFVLQTVIENRLLDALQRYLLFQKELDVEPPLLIMLSYLRVHGLRILQPIEEDDLVAPEAVVDSFECDISDVMKPVFNEIRKASGF